MLADHLNATERQKFVGGSDIAAILGVSPWKTAYALWEEKTAGIVEESTEQRDKVLRRGKRLEPVVMEMLQDEYDLAITGRNAIHFDPEHDFMRAEIDFEYLDEDGSTQNGDVKTVSPFNTAGWGAEGSDEVPSYYVAQFEWGLGITGRQKTLCVALFGADDLRLFMVERNDELIQHMRKEALRFWNYHVLKNIPPPLVSVSDAERVLAKFQGVTAPATETTRAAISYLRGIKEAEKRLEIKREHYELAIKLTLAAAVGQQPEPDKCAIVDPDSGKPLLTYNLQKRAGYTVQVKPTQYRVMRICK